jgi:transcriptional regulator with XRE-family HTH domain
MFNIKELRIKKGVTQTELANYVGVSLRSVQHWEKGTKNITIFRLEKINTFFGLNMNLSAYEDFVPETLLVAERNPEYILNNENLKKIEVLEETIREKDEQLKYFKQQVEFLKNNVTKTKNSK